MTRGSAAVDVEVETTGGPASLSGTAPDQSRRELARKVARTTRGVGELRGLLRLR